MNNRISDKTSLNISLPMIIQVVGFISAMVWGYSQLTTRMSFVENEATRNTQSNVVVLANAAAATATVTVVPEITGCSTIA